MRKLFLGVALCLGLPITAGHAQTGEVFIPGSEPIVTFKPQPQSPLANCMLNTSAAACASVNVDPDGLALESAGPALSLETVVLDLDANKVVVTKGPPPAPTYTAPKPTPTPSYTDPVAPKPTEVVPKYDDPKPLDYTAPEPPKTGKVLIPAVAITIEFDYNSDRVRSDQRGKIATLVAALNDPALQGTSYAVVGHTDAVGSPVYNCGLSERRAASVTRLLQGSNVYVPLYPVGWGEEHLKNTAYPDAAENRRVTFLRLPDTPGAVLHAATQVCRY